MIAHGIRWSFRATSEGAGSRSGACRVKPPTPPSRVRSEHWKSPAAANERSWLFASTVGRLGGVTPWLGLIPSSRAVKEVVRVWASPLAASLAGLGIRANTLTLLGLLLNILAAMMLA